MMPLWIKPWPDAGDAMEIGHEVALGIEPGERWARITGFLKNGKPMGIIVRRFRDPEEPFPTGEYRLTSAIAICPIFNPDAEVRRSLSWA